LSRTGIPALSLRHAEGDSGTTPVVALSQIVRRDNAETYV
jgi:hypothetical protein